MAEAYIVDAVRTPVGKRDGSLAATHPADLGAASLSALVGRSGIDPAAVEDVIFGCVDTIGPQAGDIAALRNPGCSGGWRVGAGVRVEVLR